MHRKPPSRLAGRLLLIALATLVALGAGHALLWRSMAEQLDTGWRNWVAVRRAQGWTVEFAPPVRGGWPFSATLDIARLRLEGMTATLPGGAALTADRLRLRITLPRLSRLVIELPGQQRLRVGGVEYPFTADSLVALVPLEPDTAAAEAEASAERLRIGTPAGGLEVRHGRLTLEGSTTATDQEPALAVTLEAEDIDLPPGPPGTPPPAFGRKVAALSADLSISGPLPPGRAPAPRAEAWRDAGGTAELRSLTLRWGPVDARAAATLTFDEALQPMGAGTLRLVGAAAVLQAMSEAGLIGRRAAGTATTMLPLLTRPNAETGVAELEVPLMLEDRTLSAGRIPVIRLPPLDWPRR